MTGAQERHTLYKSYPAVLAWEGDFMPAAPHLTFEPEELQNRALKNCREITYLAIAFATKQGVLDEFTEHFGKLLAQNWESMRGAAALEITKAMAADMVVLGAQVHTLVGNDDEAEVVLVGWPEQEMLAFAGISQTDADCMLSWYDTISTYVGVNFRAQREGDELTLRVYR